MEQSSQQMGYPTTAAADQSVEMSQNPSHIREPAQTIQSSRSISRNEEFFKEILKTLKKLDLFMVSPSIFFVYVHADPSVDEARKILDWLSDALHLNLYSDKSLSGYDPLKRHATPEDWRKVGDILSNQLWLLPSEMDNKSVDKVILCVSETLRNYIKSPLYEPYCQRINSAYQKAVKSGDQKRVYKEIRETVESHSGDPNFHHVLTELAFLRIRDSEFNIIPFFLHGSSKACLPSFVTRTNVWVDNENLHIRFFRLLRRLLEAHIRYIEAFEKCYVKYIGGISAPLDSPEIELPQTPRSLIDNKMKKELLQTLESLIDDNIATLRVTSQPDGPLIARLKRKVALDGLPAALKAYASSERLSIQRISGQLLPMELCYVNLAVVELSKPHREEQKSNQAADNEEEKPRDTFRRLPSFEEVKNDNPQALVQMEDLFNRRILSGGNTRPPPKRILIQGRAGVGKTSLCKKFLYESTKNQMWNEHFTWILWVPLRTFKLNNFSNLTDFFHEEYFHPQHKDRIFAEVLYERTHGPDKAKTLFVLDGWDEVQGLKLSTLTDLLNQSNVIITSRPTGVVPGSIDPLDLELEVIGFSQENVWTYLEHKDLVPSEEMATDIKQFIQDNPFVQEVVNVPIQLDALCYSWDEVKEKQQGDNPLTATMLYQAMIYKLWRKDIIRLEKRDQGIALTAEIVAAIRLPRRLERVVQSESDFLGALAFDRLEANRIEFNNGDIDNVIQQFESQGVQLPLTLENGLTKLSFLHTDDHDVAGSQRSYHFIHLTFQEFFAAQWLVKQLASDVSQVKDCIRRQKYNPRYEIVWWFMAGLLSGDALDSFFSWLDQGPQDLLGIQHQYLIMHCLNEAQGRLKRQQILESTLSEWVMFGLKIGNTTLGLQMAFPEAYFLRWLKDKSVLDDIALSKIISVLGQRPVLSKVAVKSLIALLKDPDRAVEYEIAEALGQQPNLPLEAAKDLILLLKDSDGPVRHAALSALRQQSNLPLGAVKDLKSLLNDADESMRSAAVETLGQQSNLPLEVAKDLIPLLNDPVGSVRSAAAGALGQQSNLPLEAAKDLIPLLKDSDRPVRHAAIRALSQQSNLPLEAVADLIRLFENPDKSIQYTAPETLLQLSNLPLEAAKDLMPLLKDPDKFVRTGAAWALRQQLNLPLEAAKDLIPLLKDPYGPARSAAVMALGRQSNLPLEAVKDLISLLNDPVGFLRPAAIMALGGQSNLPLEAVKNLVPLLNDPVGSVRFAAAEVLGKQSNLPLEVLRQQSNLPLEVIKDVIPLLKDPDKSVRTTAAWALRQQLNLPLEAAKDLVLLLKDSDGPAWSAAVSVLGWQSNLPLEAVKDLILLLKDPDRSLRYAVVKALELQSNLPFEAVKALILLLKDADELVQSRVARILGRQSIEQLYRQLEILEHSVMEPLYSEYLIKQRTSQTTPLYLENNTLFFYTSSGLESVQLRNEAAFRRSFLKVQKETGIPEASWVKLIG